MFTYKTRGTCSSSIDLEVSPDGIITSCAINGGCHGNTQGVSILVKGMQIDDAISKLSGIQCRNGTSCPDQLAKALTQYKQQYLAS